MVPSRLTAGKRATAHSRQLAESQLNSRAAHKHWLSEAQRSTPVSPAQSAGVLRRLLIFMA